MNDATKFIPKLMIFIILESLTSNTLLSERSCIGNVYPSE